MNIYFMIWVHGDSHKPVVRTDTSHIQILRPKNIKTKKSDHYSLDCPLEQPHEEVLQIEDAIFLTYKVYFRHESIEIFIDAKSVGQIAHLSYQTLLG